MSNVTIADPKVVLTVPAGVSHQPWDCTTLTGTKGDTVFTEQVGIGSSLSVGASKNGTRNVIPITGGTVTGKVTGNVVAGGADYQLLGGTTPLRRALQHRDERQRVHPDTQLRPGRFARTDLRSALGRALRLPQREHVLQLGPGRRRQRRDHQFLRQKVARRPAQPGASPERFAIASTAIVTRERAGTKASLLVGDLHVPDLRRTTEMKGPRRADDEARGNGAHVVSR